MPTWALASIMTIIFGVGSFLLGPVFWPVNTMWDIPVGAQLPLLIGVSVIESIYFGLGLSFLIIGWPIVRNVKGSARLAAWSIYLGSTWAMASWWAHDSMHRMIAHNDYWALIKIEYGFHVTQMIAAGLIAYGFFDVMRWYRKAKKG